MLILTEVQEAEEDRGRELRRPRTADSDDGAGTPRRQRAPLSSLRFDSSRPVHEAAAAHTRLNTYVRRSDEGNASAASKHKGDPASERRASTPEPDCRDAASARSATNGLAGAEEVNGTNNLDQQRRGLAWNDAGMPPQPRSCAGGGCTILLHTFESVV